MKARTGILLELQVLETAVCNTVDGTCTDTSGGQARARAADQALPD